MSQSWSESEYAALLECVDQYAFDLSLLVSEAMKKTDRSEKSITRKLMKIGFLHGGKNTKGRPFNKKLGHIS